MRYGLTAFGVTLELDSFAEHTSRKAEPIISGGVAYGVSRERDHVYVREWGRSGTLDHTGVCECGDCGHECGSYDI